MAGWRLLCGLVVVALAPAAFAQEPVLVVGQGETLLAPAPCGGEAVVQALGLILVRGTVQAVADPPCVPDPNATSAPRGVSLSLVAPAIVLDGTAVVAAGAGGDAADRSPNGTVVGPLEVAGQDGGHGGNLTLRGTLQLREGSLRPGAGGRGGSVDGAFTGAGRLVVRGGRGGGAGQLFLDTPSPPQLSLQTQHPAPGGRGGNAIAKAADGSGLHVAALGGDGGDGWPSNAVQGSDGGDAAAKAGDGADGRPGNPDGAAGGDAVAQGGAAGAGWPAGRGGTALAQGGNGGRGADVGQACVAPDQARGGQGGPGGEARATFGAGWMPPGESGVALASGGRGGPGGQGNATQGVGGEGGDGGDAHATATDEAGGRVRALGGDGGAGGHGRMRAGRGGDGGDAFTVPQRATPFSSDAGAGGAAGRLLPGVACTKDGAVTSIGGLRDDPLAEPGLHGREAPAAGLLVLLTLAGAALLARRR